MTKILARSMLLLLCTGCALLAGHAARHAATESILQQAAAGDMADEPTVFPYTIVIDAGHGGEDAGTQSAAGLPEKDVNLDIACMLEDMLHTCGIPTVMTRTEDRLLYDPNDHYHGRKKMLDLAARRDIAEQTENALFVSIHMNAFPETKYRGLQVFYSQNHPQSQILASRIQMQSRKWLAADNRREIKPATSAIYLLDNLQCPAVLVECGFLSNPEEAALFESHEHRQKVAFTLFCAILAHISAENA